MAFFHTNFNFATRNRCSLPKAATVGESEETQSSRSVGLALRGPVRMDISVRGRVKTRERLPNGQEVGDSDEASLGLDTDWRTVRILSILVIGERTDITHSNLRARAYLIST